MWPELFKCPAARAYVVECQYPEWSPDYDATYEPYNAPDNACVDHSNGSSASSLSGIAAQLVVTLDTSDEQPLIRGENGVDGNIPELGVSSIDVTACIDFKDDGGESRQRFEQILTEYVW